MSAMPEPAPLPERPSRGILSNLGQHGFPFWQSFPGWIRSIYQQLPPGLGTGLFVCLSILIFAIRLYHCSQMPAHTGDISRHLYYGLLVNRDGLGVAGSPLQSFGSAYSGVAWSQLPYNYPIITLGFFSLITWISPTLFFARFALTMLEATSSVLIWSFTRERWLSLLYWASPISIWWTSREGQFEALQNVFVCLSFACLLRFPSIACLFLAVAVQVKLTAILLVPYFLSYLWFSQRHKMLRCTLSFLAGFIPTGFALFYFPALEQLKYSAPLVYNPYFWNIFDKAYFSWNPPTMIWANQLSSYGILGLLLLGFIFFSRERLAYLAPLLFLAVCKWHQNVQFWYMVLFPSFILPIRNPRYRWLLFSISPTLDLYSLAMVISGPLYLNVGGYYGSLTPFTPFQLL